MMPIGRESQITLNDTARRRSADGLSPSTQSLGPSSRTAGKVSVLRLQPRQSLGPQAAGLSVCTRSEHELGHPTFKFIQKPMDGIART